MNLLRKSKRQMSPEERKEYQETAKDHGKCMLSRRNFLMYSGATVAAASTVSVTLFPGTAEAKSMKAKVIGYPRKLIAKLSELKDNSPINFNYPDNDMNSQIMLVKLGDVKAGGGVGEQQDIVAFSYLCTHQGGPLQGTYKVTDDQRTLGMCPLHLSVYDLRRHGIIVSGQAYESLPQVLLEIEGDSIYAVGMMGLLYGRNRNLDTEKEV